MALTHHESPALIVENDATGAAACKVVMHSVLLHLICLMRALSAAACALAPPGSALGSSACPLRELDARMFATEGCWFASDIEVVVDSRGWPALAAARSAKGACTDEKTHFGRLCAVRIESL